MNKKTAGLAAGVTVASVVGAAFAVPSFAPESDLARALGNLEKKWAGVYTSFISDGDVEIQPSEIALKSDIVDVDLSGYVMADDARLTDARAPTAHAASHAIGGTDELSPASIGAMVTAPFGDRAYLASGDGWIEYVPPEQAEDGTFDHAQLFNRDAADQHPQTAITGLSGDLTAIRGDIAAKADASALDDYATVAALTSGLAGKASVSHAHTIADVTGLQTTLDAKAAASSLAGYVPTGRTITASAPLTGGGALTGNITLGVSDATTSARGVMSAADKTKLDGIAAGAQVNAVASVSGRTGAVVLTSSDVGLGNVNNTSDANKPISTATQTALDAKANATHTHTTAQVVGLDAALAAKSTAIIGEIRLLPFRKAELPAGWYYPSGDYFALTSVVGIALNSLPANYKSDWGITVSGSTIRLFDPTKFFSGNYGRFLRPVNGSSRNPGSTEDDAIRNITGRMLSYNAHVFSPNYSNGAFKAEAATGSAPSSTTAATGATAFNMDASLQVPTAAENRPYNVGMTPAVYLGE